MNIGIEKVNEQIQLMTQDTAAKIAVGIGSGGTVLQLATDYASLVAGILNLVLVCGGLYIIYPKIVSSYKKRRLKKG